MAKGFDYIYNTNGISRPVSECSPCVGEDGNENVLLHVKQTRVEGEQPGTKPGYSELFSGEGGGHESTDGEAGN